MPEQGFQRRAAGCVEKMKDHIDGLMLIVKKLGQLIDQKDESYGLKCDQLKELSRKLQAAIKKTQLNNRIKK